MEDKYKLATCPFCRRELCYHPGFDTDYFSDEEWERSGSEEDLEDNDAVDDVWESIGEAHAWLCHHGSVVDEAVFNVWGRLGERPCWCRLCRCRTIVEAFYEALHMVGFHLAMPGSVREWVMVKEVIERLESLAQQAKLDTAVLGKIVECLFDGIRDIDIEKGYRKAGLGVLIAEERTGYCLTAVEAADDYCMNCC
jgi:hypothetical protein